MAHGAAMDAMVLAERIARTLAAEGVHAYDCNSRIARRRKCNCWVRKGES
ncbi:hypothetical protein Pan2_76 [Pseudanabaena phage Pan2]|nr:hypothetical protein Pan2_76 [Pseudanabaena phage Pan2]